jgi:hypothetical protein
MRAYRFISRKEYRVEGKENMAMGNTFFPRVPLTQILCTDFMFPMLALYHTYWFGFSGTTLIFGGQFKLLSFSL